jgi:hypothetical protein
LESIGCIKFGMDRDEVHRLLGAECVEFKKNKFSKNTSDDYKKFHIFYTPDNKVDALEFFDDVEIIMEGKVIFPIHSAEIEKLIPHIEKEGNYYTQAGKSIGIEVNSGKAESILVGAKGYF